MSLPQRVHPGSSKRGNFQHTFSGHPQTAELRHAETCSDRPALCKNTRPAFLHRSHGGWGGRRPPPAAANCRRCTALKQYSRPHAQAVCTVCGLAPAAPYQHTNAQEGRTAANRCSVQQPNLSCHGASLAAAQQSPWPCGHGLPPGIAVAGIAVATARPCMRCSTRAHQHSPHASTPPCSGAAVCEAIHSLHRTHALPVPGQRRNGSFTGSHRVRAELHHW